MPSPIRAIRVNHINTVLEDYDRVVAHFDRLFGGRVILDMPNELWHANLTDIGRVIVEVFVPHDFFLHTRYGPHYIGIEFQIEDLAAAREVCASRGIRVARELNIAFHSNPADCHGVSLEMYEGYFHDNNERLHAPMQSAEWWRDEHPLGLDGLRAVTIGVHDLAARADFEAVFQSEVAYEEPRPDDGAVALGLRIADTVLELAAPTAEGPLQQHLRAHGEGIRSTVFGVRDLEQARRYFAEREVELVAGSAPGRLAIPPEKNLGLLFEFSE